jgi:hypothetical protein
MLLDDVLPDCQYVYYVKQLSASDAASSKQIKLPKTEAKRFAGDLRHKQAAPIVSPQPAAAAAAAACPPGLLACLQSSPHRAAGSTHR